MQVCKSPSSKLSYLNEQWCWWHLEYLVTFVLIIGTSGAKPQLGLRGARHFKYKNLIKATKNPTTKIKFSFSAWSLTPPTPHHQSRVQFHLVPTTFFRVHPHQYQSYKWSAYDDCDKKLMWHNPDQYLEVYYGRFVLKAVFWVNTIVIRNCYSRNFDS